jgi:hypothetical protein
VTGHVVRPGRLIPSGQMEQRAVAGAGTADLAIGNVG